MLAIIPARKGSERFPNKNTKLLGGKPLISYTIEAALESPVVTHTLVVSNDEEVWSTVEKYSHDLWFLYESDAMASPDVPMVDVALYTLDTCKKNMVELPPSFVVLQPTSPFRTSADILGAWEVMEKHDAYSVISVRPIREHPDWMKLISRDNRLSSTHEGPAERQVSQDLVKLYYPNGAIYMCRTEWFREFKTFYTNNTFAYRMLHERSIDIDYEIDLKLAELLMEK
jgi:CMP-N-acetylneuraminic acid synthetase